MGSDVLKTDVFIVGGGPAGLATGIALRQRRLSVVVADPARPPIDKACGEGLMPQTVAELQGLGVTLAPSQAIPFRGIRFIGEGRVAEGAFPQGYGLGIRRTTLHQALVERAAAVGVQTLWGTRVRGIDEGEVSLDSGKVRCRWIIGADGQNSLVRKWAGLDRGRPQETRFGFRQHFRVAPWTDFVEVHWGCNCQIVITPVSRDEICLVVTSRTPQLRLKEALNRVPGNHSAIGRVPGRHQRPWGDFSPADYSQGLPRSPSPWWETRPALWTRSPARGWGWPSSRQMLWPRRWPTGTFRATRWRTGASIACRR